MCVFLRKVDLVSQDFTLKNKRMSTVDILQLMTSHVSTHESSILQLEFLNRCDCNARLVTCEDWGEGGPWVDWNWNRTDLKSVSYCSRQTALASRKTVILKWMSRIEISSLLKTEKHEVLYNYNFPGYLKKDLTGPSLDLLVQYIYIAMVEMYEEKENSFI